MKYYSFDNVIDVDVEIAKSLLELSDDEFYKYENFINEFNSLIQSKDYNQLEFKEACENFLNNKKMTFRLCKKLYRDFILKYSTFIKKNISLLNCHSVDKVYKLLKASYRNKEAVLDRMKTLSETGIHHFLYVFEPCLNDNLVQCNSSNKIIDIATDGSITYEKCNGPYYHVKIKNAKYILEYSKELKYDWAYTDWTMIVCNLMFDTSTLPTYEQLNNFEIKPTINYKKAKQQTEIYKQKQELTDYISYMEDTLNAIQNLKIRLEKIINSVKNNSDYLFEKELQQVQDLYDKLNVYKKHFVSQYGDYSLRYEEDKITDKIESTKQKSLLR